jgi:predicted naringenin-chalcone synthase
LVTTELRTKILAIATAVPPYQGAQEATSRWSQRVARAAEDAEADDAQEARRSAGAPARLEAVIDRIYRRSAIDFRQSVIPDYIQDAEDFTFYPNNWLLDPEPSTGCRMEHFREHAPALASEAVHGCLSAAGMERGDRRRISHLIVVTCTGFFAPGLDVLLVQELGLRPDVERLMVGFMGCHAALSATRMANAICRADPDAIVLMVCVELCTLHFQRGLTMRNLVANSLFSDGAAAVLFSATPFAGRTAAYEITGCKMGLAPATTENMTWTIGDTGFQMVVDETIPLALRDVAPDFVEGLLAAHDVRRSQIDFWAIHPGGRRILEAVETSLAIPSAAMRPSYEVLAAHGNMSSPTILFVLDRLRRQSPPARGQTGLALAFGPGVTVEGVVLRAA